MDGVSGASAIASLVVLGGKLVVQFTRFIHKAKDAPNQLQNIFIDLKSTVLILGDLQAALETPDNVGLFSLQSARSQFDFVIECMMALFQELSLMADKYDKPDKWWWKRTKWAAGRLDDATDLGKRLATHKANLMLTLQLVSMKSQSRSVENSAEGLPVVVENINRLRQQVPGEKDRHLDGWLQSMSQYAGSMMGPEDAATIPHDWSPGSSTLNLTPAERAIEIYSSGTQGADNTDSGTPLQQVPSKPKIASMTFKDIHGGVYLFPLALCQTWEGMHDLVCKVSDRDEAICARVREKEYDLIGPSGSTILPEHWEMLVQPDWTITMRMPMAKEPLPTPSAPVEDSTPTEQHVVSGPSLSGRHFSQIGEMLRTQETTDFKYAKLWYNSRYAGTIIVRPSTLADLHRKVRSVGPSSSIGGIHETVRRFG